MRWLGQRMMRWLSDWLTREVPPPQSPFCDFKRICYELRPGDVLLVEGRSRVSNVIKQITQSSWTHSALYIGRIYDIRDPLLRQRVRMAYHGDLEEQLLVEALLGQGTIIVPVSKYRRDHVRICRPTGLEPEDAQRVLGHTIHHLGMEYDMRHLLDLARFFFPWTILPRRWRSSLFEHNAGMPTRTVCSSLIASAFNSVDFPILPFIDRDDDGSLRFFKRNPRLFSPKDFDYSPYFDIIKYPFIGLDELSVYRRLPWSDEEILYNDDARRFAATRSLTTQASPARRVFRFIPRKTKAQAQEASSESTEELSITDAPGGAGG